MVQSPAEDEALCFDCVYAFCFGSLAKDWTVCEISHDIIGELLIDMLLSLFGRVDLQLLFFIAYWRDRCVD